MSFYRKNEGITEKNMETTIEGSLLGFWKLKEGLRNC